jgi:hypothetical protein
MLNPFLGPALLAAERARRQREKFKIGVYATLVTATVFLTGLLIQGCRNSQGATEAGGQPVQTQVQ